MQMSIAAKYNKKHTTWTVEAKEDAEFYKLADLVKKDKKTDVYHVVRGMFANNKGYYGKHYVLVIDNGDILLDLPNHLTGVCDEMLADDDVIAAINAGLFGIKIYSYTSRKYRTNAYSIEWVDLSE